MARGSSSVAEQSTLYPKFKCSNSVVVKENSKKNVSYQFVSGNRYDPRKFSKSRSIVTFVPHDRNLGNVISAYLILLW
jgi:hypothetical protein